MVNVILWVQILASCAYDPKHPNAPCHDVVYAPLWPFALGLGTLIATGIGLAMLIRKRRRSRTDPN
jgi:hypothetical protein